MDVPFIMPFAEHHTGVIRPLDIFALLQVCSCERFGRLISGGTCAPQVSVKPGVGHLPNELR